MPLVIKDRIKETTTTTGTDTYNLGGAVAGFETFNQNLSNGDTTFYCCTDGTDFEVGSGVFTTSGTTLTRNQISSSNNNNKVFWGSGTKTIFCTVPADRLPLIDSGALQLTGDLTLTHNSLVNSNPDPKITLQRNSTGPANNDSLGQIVFGGENDNDQQIDYAIITGQIADNTDGTEDGRLLISLEVNATLTDAYAFDTNVFQLKNEQAIQWENYAGTSYDVNLVAGNPSASRTITLPDITGTVVVEGTSGTSLTNDLSILKTDSSSSVNPVLNLFRVSDSPADDDNLAVIRFYGSNSSVGALSNYGELRFVAKDITNGSEDGSFLLKADVNGTLTTVLSNEGTTLKAGSDTIATREQLKGDATNGAGVFSDELIARKLHVGTIITKQDDSSQVMIAGRPNGGFNSQTTCGADRGHFMPIMIPGTGAGDTTNIASFAYKTGFSGTVNNATVHLGLYTLNKFGYPSQLVSKGSVASGTSNNAFKTVTPDVTAITPGRYAMCLACEGSSVLMTSNFNSTNAGGSFYTEGFSDTSLTPRPSGLMFNSLVSSSAIPTDLSGSGGFFDSTTIPFIIVILADTYSGE